MNKRNGFTLIELITVIAIICLLSAMLLPEVGKFQDRAQSVVCVNNLRQIGAGVLSYLGENDNTYPVIEPNENNPVYTDGEFEEITAKPMLDVLAPYGVTDQVLKCPTDIKGANWYAKQDPHTSYEWRITVDHENAVAPKVYGGRRGYGVRIAKPSRVTICTDFEGIHAGKMNRLYADGHVSKPN